MAEQNQQTLGERLPDALARIGRFLGSDAALKINRDFVADIMALHVAASVSVSIPAPSSQSPHPKPGMWPQSCVQRAFVEGAQWWQFHGHGSTMFGSERDEAEVEAVNRYGQPEVASTTNCP